jgi:hypothetical protein
MQSGLRSTLGTPVNSNDINIKTEPHERGSILVAAVFDVYFIVYTRRTFSLFRVFRAGGGTTDRGDLPVPLAERLAAEANRTAEQFFVICARALDCCPPVDLTFGDFLRAVLTSDLDFHPDDPDGVRDALMQAFRLRGIVADEVASFSEDSLFWPKVKHDLLKVEGLVFGGRRMPTETCFASLPSRTQRILVLIRIGGRSMRLRSIRCSTPGRTVACSSIWSSSWCRRCKSPSAIPIPERFRCATASRCPFPRILGWRRQAAAKGPVCDPETLDQGAGRARAKLLSFHRTSARQCGRRWREGPIALSNQLWFIARGGSKMAAAKRAASGPKRSVAKKVKRSVLKPAKTARQTPASGASSAPAGSSRLGATGLRVRMYRLGFGDFFLLTVPTGARRASDGWHCPGLAIRHPLWYLASRHPPFAAGLRSRSSAG